MHFAKLLKITVQLDVCGGFVQEEDFYHMHWRALCMHGNKHPHIYQSWAARPGP